MNELAFRIHGMDCADEVAVLRSEIGPLVGGDENLAFDLLRGKLTISRSTSAVTPATVEQIVGRLGMRAEVWRDSDPMGQSADAQRRRARIGLTVVSGISCLGGLVAHIAIAGSVSGALGSEGSVAAHGVPWLARLLYAAAIVTGGWFVAPKAWSAARRVRPDMNLLMLIAVIGAVAINEWFEAASVAFLFALSLALESWSVGRASRAVSALLELAPPTARVVGPDGREQETPIASVQAGAIYRVKPGERVPLDGLITGGISDVNQAPITGESVPVPRTVGDTLLAGTINGNGALEARSTKIASQTTLAQITRMVGEAQSRRGPSEQWVERFARIYTPTVMLIALLTLLIPPLLLDAAWNDWVYRSLVLLVIACPCALVISTPVSIVAALAAAAKNGVLVKGGAAMELPSRIRAMALDKTGTLTRGELEVVEIVPLAKSTKEVLRIAAAMESKSDHPAARAIVALAKARDVAVEEVHGFEIIPGKGALASMDGESYWLGSHRYLEERKQETPEIHDRIEVLSGPGRTVVLLGNNTSVCALFVLSDAIREEAAESIRALRKAGIQHIVMLTGDNRATAGKIAKETGLDDVGAELLPGEKVTAVERLVSKYGQVAMVGDGVNDAPAMGRASLGIAMGAAGSDAAIEAADVALMSDDLAKLPWLIEHSKSAVRIIRQNTTVSLVVKAIFVVLTLLGHASLWSAIAADTGASLLVISNALRLLRAGPTPPSERSAG